jgi:hypothetical protein
MSKFRKKKGKKNQEFQNQDSKFLKYAFISGILIVFLFILSVVLNILFSDNTGVLRIISIAQNVLTIIFTFYFFLGFIILGRRYNKLLKIASILMIIIVVGYYFLVLFSASFFGKNLMLKLDEKVKSVGFNSTTEFFDYLSNNQTEAQKYSEFITKDIVPLILPMAIIIFSYLLIVLIVSILFGAGLIKLGGIVKYARIAGILGIIGICTMILFIGFFIWIVAYVFMLIILFRESRKK